MWSYVVRITSPYTVTLNLAPLGTEKRVEQTKRLFVQADLLHVAAKEAVIHGH